MSNKSTAAEPTAGASCAPETPHHAYRVFTVGLRTRKSAAEHAVLARELGATVLDCRPYITKGGPFGIAAMAAAFKAAGVAYHVLPVGMPSPEGVRSITGRVLALTITSEPGGDPVALAIGDANPGTTVHCFAETTTTPVADMPAISHEDLRRAIIDPAFDDPCHAIEWYFPATHAKPAASAA